MRPTVLGVTFLLAAGLLVQEAPALAPAESKPDNHARRSTGVRMPVARHERDPFHTYRTRYWRFYGPTSRAAEHYVPSRSYGRYPSSYHRDYSSDAYHRYSSGSYSDYSSGAYRRHRSYSAGSSIR